MPAVKILAVAAVALMPPTMMAAPSIAATAHNSQAGAFGPDKNACGPTPYFPAGGCLSSFLADQDDGEVLPAPGRYRERPPLRALDR